MNKNENCTIPVSLSFDDGNAIQRRVFFPILSDYGMSATFYVITNAIGRRGHMTYGELGDLYRNGNEVGSHTHTHPHLTELPDNLLDFELRRSRELLEMFACKTLAYPFGEYDSRVMACAQQYYAAARSYYDLNTRSRDCGYNLGLSTERYRLRVFPTEHVFPSENTPLLDQSLLEFQRSVRRVVENAIEKQAWLVFVFHGRQGFSFRVKWLSGLSSKFRWLCEFLVSNDRTRVLTVCEAIERLYDNHSS